MLAELLDALDHPQAGAGVALAEQRMPDGEAAGEEGVEDAVELLERLAEQARLDKEDTLAADYYSLALESLSRLPDNKRIREVRADLLLEMQDDWF